MRTIRVLAAAALAVVLGVFLFVQPAWAAPSLTACPSGYICFWEHKNYAGVKSMYYRPSGCVRLPHGTGYVGNKVSSMWNRSGVSAKVYDNDVCGWPNFAIQFNNGNGYSDLAGQFNDRISSFRRDGT